MDLCWNGSIHWNHNCSAWNTIRADIAHVQVQLPETWVEEEREKKSKMMERRERKRTVMGGHARVRVLSKLAGLSLKKYVPLLCKEAPEQISDLCGNMCFKGLTEMEISSSTALAEGRRDNFGLPWSS